MLARSSRVIPIVLASTLFACSVGNADDDFSLVGTHISVAEIAGNWTATRALFGRSAAGPVQEVDLVAEGGAVTLLIQTNGRFTLTIMRIGEAPEVSTGRLGFDEDLLVVSFDDDPDDFTFFGISYAEPNLSIRGGAAATFDFDGDGVEEAADVAFDFVRS